MTTWEWDDNNSRRVDTRYPTRRDNATDAFAFTLVLLVLLFLLWWV